MAHLYEEVSLGQLIRTANRKKKQTTQEPPCNLRHYVGHQRVWEQLVLFVNQHAPSEDMYESVYVMRYRAQETRKDTPQQGHVPCTPRLCSKKDILAQIKQLRHDVIMP